MFDNTRHRKIFSCSRPNWEFVQINGLHKDGEICKIHKISKQCHCPFEVFKKEVFNMSLSTYLRPMIYKINEDYCIVFTDRPEELERFLSRVQENIAPEYIFHVVTQKGYILDLPFIKEGHSPHYTCFKIKTGVEAFEYVESGECD